MAKKRIFLVAAAAALVSGALFFAGCQTPEEIAAEQSARASARAVAAQKAAPTLNVPEPAEEAADDSVVTLRTVSGTVELPEPAPDPSETAAASAKPVESTPPSADHPAEKASSAPTPATAAAGASAASPVSGTSAPTDPYARLSKGTDFEVLQIGSQGDLVTKLQQYLADLGYYAPEPNGTFDKETEKAVEALQERNSLVSDGIVGNSTWDLLIMANGRPAD